MVDSILPQLKVELVSPDPTNLGMVSMGPKPKLTQFIDVSHNWCDKTTWHTNALKRTGAQLSLNTQLLADDFYYLDDGQGGEVPFWIDFINHKIYRGSIRHKDKRVRVYDNGVEVVVAGFGQDKDTPGVDCEVDHVNGRVFFGAGYTVTGPVSADLYHVDESLPAGKKSEFKIVVPYGKKIALQYVEPQFTKGVVVNDSCHFAAFMPLGFLAIQSDNLLDPKALVENGELVDGMTFLITDASNLHTNFGTIGGLEDNDIVMYCTGKEDGSQDSFEVWFDASENDGIGALNFSDQTTWLFQSGSWVQTPFMYSMWEIPGTRDSYHRFQCYLRDATGNYPVIPAGFCTGERGLTDDIIQIKFDWVGSKVLDQSKGVQLRVWLENDVEWGPSRSHEATASFYGSVH